MTRPNWCPQDVWEAVEVVGEAIYGRHERGFVMWPLVDGELIRPAIARAILAERQRCVDRVKALANVAGQYDNAIAAIRGTA